MVLIGDRELSVPIIQGGMGVGVSLGGLAGAVAKEGAMGVISSVNAGYRKDYFNTDPLKANEDALREEIKKAFDIADGRGMVAVNIMVAVNNYKETVINAVQCGIDAIISGAGLPLELPQFVAGSSTAIAPVVSSGKSAKVICKVWDKKYGVIPDFIVLEGPKAGGHLGFDKETILAGTAGKITELLMDVLKSIKPFEEKYKRKIPVFAGGGIFDAKDIKEVLAYGASGVVEATRFIATKECDASDGFKQMMVNASSEDITIVNSPVGMPGRALNTELIKNLEKGISFNPKICNNCLKTCPKAGKTPYCISRALIDAVKGNTQTGLFFCGANVGRVDKIVSVKELINELKEGWKNKNEDCISLCRTGQSEDRNGTGHIR